MNEEIKVIKIKTEDGKELDVNWILDLGNRCIKKSSIDRKVFFELFNLKSSFSFSDIPDLNLILYSDNCLYYCNNCIFGFNINTNGEFSVFCNSMDYIISNTSINYEQLKIKQYEINFELPQCIKNNYIGFDIQFEYSKNIKVNFKKVYRTKLPCLIVLTITSKKEVYADKLVDIAYKIYEILMIYFGVGLNITNRILIVDDIKMYFYASIVDKYSYGVKNSISFSNFVVIDEFSLNKNILKKYETFVKETSILKDIYLTIINSDTYREIKINMMLQCIEGFYRCIYDKKKQLSYKQILEIVFLKNNYCKKVLSNLDRRIVVINGKNENIFLYKAKNHRNYFSHLNINERKNMFEKMQINYAYWKIILVYRLLLLEYLNVKYDKKLLNEIIIDINNYKKKNKIRLSL